MYVCMYVCMYAYVYIEMPTRKANYPNTSNSTIAYRTKFYLGIKKATTVLVDHSIGSLPLCYTYSAPTMLYKMTAVRPEYILPLVVFGLYSLTRSALHALMQILMTFQNKECLFSS